MSLIEGIFDGCCEPRNPGGHAAWGAVVKVDGQLVWESSGYCGVGPTMSNNVAEYSGVLAVLNFVNGIHGSLLIRGDSKLVIEQLSGRWKIHGGLYVPFYRQAKTLVDQQRTFRKGNLAFKWVPRDENSDCDYLSKNELHKRGVVFRIQPEAAPKAVAV